MLGTLRPGPADATGLPDLRLDLPATLDELADPERARAHAVELRRALCPGADRPAAIRPSCGSASTWSRRATSGTLPEQTWLGWLLYLMSAHLPFTVAPTSTPPTARGSACFTSGATGGFTATTGGPR